ncbi:hypothetical protein [Anaerolinea thermophila]|uniref:CDP-glycerol:poly(Glycerophosphate) glycerophosphotransferase n=2 Tax=Anaerolinea TaxID=233189 RepID=E8N1S0_ANATU|nr:hypothetical protein [Anaerolinea thermophila]BAJ62675.1 hypothetical protein ANT_06410 [Anaerolinea thermophila UNI-1]
MTDKTIFISADHGLSIVYFLQTDVLPTLLESGARVVVLTDDGIRDQIAAKFSQPNLIIEGLRFRQCREYFEKNDHSLQYWMHFLRWMGGSNRINTNAMDGHLRQMAHEASPRGKRLMPLIRGLTYVLRRSRLARQALVNFQRRYTPNIYGDLFEKYQPSLVVASTPGWRWDRYLLREAAARGIPTAAVIVGWDNPSSYRLPGAPVDWITCWSEIQKQELVLGSDWKPERVHVGGIPSYDGYFRGTWKMSREEYFRLHGLDPNRKLLSYACSFVTFSPNFANIRALAELVHQDALAEPTQLLIRLHPNHFQPGSLYEQEANRVRELIRGMPHVHLVEPVPLGGELGYYSGEDMPEKASMMAYSDVFLTVYSTMVVETAIHDRPIVSVCIDEPGGWNTPGKFSLSLQEIGEWPTHLRFRAAGAGRVAYNAEQLKDILNLYLRAPETDSAQRRKFIQDECTFTDGSAGWRTGTFLRSLLERGEA